MAGDSWSALLLWVHSSGGRVHESLRRTQILHGDIAVYGVVATKPLPKGTVLARLPRALLLSVGGGGNSADVKAVATSTLPRGNGCDLTELNDLKLAAVVALEFARGNASLYAPYMRMLPDMNDFRTFHPSLAEDAVVADYRELPVVQVYRKAFLEKNNLLMRCFEAWQRTHDSPVASLTWDQIEHANYLLKTRAYRVSAQPMLVPILDFLNTAPAASTNVRWAFNGNILEIQSTKAIAAGDELFLSYCETCDNEEMVGHWGVYFEHNPLKLNSFEIASCSADLRDVTLKAIDGGAIEHSLQARLTAPPCRETTLRSDAQGHIRCSLARLAWESCASAWGYRGWRGPAAQKNHAARQRHADVRYNLGLALQSQGDLRGAEESYRAALALMPGDSEIHYNLGVLMRRGGDLVKARDHLEKAVRLSPNDRQSHAMLSTILDKLNAVEDAAKSRRA
eukprot:TRINITY_DN37943_c0_g1_i1.p1 TRINITY_DN37943_c0_g1~~TRINITY_DN37943_c0_g1_i1.p1  ORF type:complete len:528 (+),score=56.47 TRINITY_DN37943_c0_g1_i1:227-1585(+)